MPIKDTNEIISSFYADDTAYAASEAPHAGRKSFAGDKLQESFYPAYFRIQLCTF